MLVNSFLVRNPSFRFRVHGIASLEHIDMEGALLIPPVAQMCVREKDYMELLSSMRNVADIIVSIGCFPFDNTNRYKHCSILVHNDIQKVTKVKRHLY